MNRYTKKIINLIDAQERISGRGFFRDEVDNINGLIDTLRHLSESDCEKLGVLNDTPKYKNKILSVVENNDIPEVVKERIKKALE